VAHAETQVATDGGTPATSNTTPSMTFSANETALGGLTCWDGGASCQSVTNVRLDNTTDLTLAATVESAGVNAFKAWIYYLPTSPSAASHSLTVNWGGSNTYEGLYLTRVSGAQGTLSGSCATATGTSAAPASGNVSGASTAFYYGVLAAAAGSGYTAGSGRTIPTNGTTGTGAVEYVANPGATPQNMDFTMTSADWAVVGCAFAVASSPAPCLMSLLGVGSC
jgi:hypothetical protein